MANLPSQMMANAIRALAMDAVEAAKSGHPGMPMGMADAATVLFANHLKFDASQPDWPDERQIYPVSRSRIYAVICVAIFDRI